MLKTLKYMFLIQNTYMKNGISYYITKLPLLNKVIDSSLHQNNIYKKIISLLNILIQLGKIFLGKVIYIIMVELAANLMINEGLSELSISQAMMNLLVWLTISGALINCFVLEPKKDINYAIMFIKLDANKVVKAGLLKFIFFAVIGICPMYFLTSFRAEQGLLNILLLLVILVSSKITGAGIKIYIKRNNHKISNVKLSYIDMGIGLVLALIGVVISVLNIQLTTSIVTIIALIMMILSIALGTYVFRFDGYLKIYKDMFSEYGNIINEGGGANPKMVKQNSEKYIKLSADDNIDGRKTGYDYFNDIFMKRHKHILSEMTSKIMICEAIVFLGIIIAVIVNKEFAQGINGEVMGFAYVSIYFIYYLNYGERASKVLFTNCDCEMLTAKYYREPKAILSLFKYRLKSIVVMDWVQSLPIAVGIAGVLMLSGGATVFYEYINIFLTIITFSTFFSVHNLVIYYLFQPYNKDFEVKSPVLFILKFVTYILCMTVSKTGTKILEMGRSVNMLFGVVCLVICIIYIVTSLILVYKLAPKTFRLK